MQFFIQCTKLSKSLLTFYLPPPHRGAELRSIEISVSVCMSVCPLAYLKNFMSELYQTFDARCLSPWLVPPVCILSVL